MSQCAPQVAMQGPHGLPADLWSVGCLFYSLVAGRPPFQGQEAADTMEQASRGQYDEPYGISTAAKDFLRSLLQTVRLRRG
jgi:polo-like kinase 4